MRVFVSELWKRPAKIIIGIDIGTTQSAVTFAHLYPDGPQALHRVAHWPGQQTQKGESKIPTLAYYNKDKEAVAFGAEALKPEIIDQAEAEGWQLAQYFKLHLHPDTMKQTHNLTIPPLPEGVSLQKIYTDFMMYLLKHTQKFFETRIVDGKKTWAEFHGSKEIVIAHPNGWSIREQNFLRKAAICAGYTTEAKSLTHIHFVSEAEASVHFCMFHSDLHNKLEPDSDLIVCDAGGSTIDTTAYHVRKVSPLLQLEEKKASACAQAGAIFIDLECREHLTSVLKKLELPDDEYRDCLRDGVADFENSAKKAFETVESEQRISLGSRWTRQDLGIRRGTITIPGRIIQSFFDRSVDETIATIRRQMIGFKPQHILLVGGFGESPYLRQTIMSEFENPGCTVTIANDPTSKAVADGAVIWWAKLSVTRRATRMPYGTIMRPTYDPRNPIHAGRPRKKGNDGILRVEGAWSQIVDKDVVMNVAQKVRESYNRKYQSPEWVTGKSQVIIYAWTINNAPPGYWLEDKDGRLNAGFKKMCTVEFNKDEMRSSLKMYTGHDGVYYALEYDVVLMFGGTELQAYVEWEQDEETKVTQATIIPDAL